MLILLKNLGRSIVEKVENSFFCNFFQIQIVTHLQFVYNHMIRYRRRQSSSDGFMFFKTISGGFCKQSAVFGIFPPK